MKQPIDKLEHFVGVRLLRVSNFILRRKYKLDFPGESKLREGLVIQNFPSYTMRIFAAQVQWLGI